MIDFDATADARILRCDVEKPLDLPSKAQRAETSPRTDQAGSFQKGPLASGRGKHMDGVKSPVRSLSRIDAAGGLPVLIKTFAIRPVARRVSRLGRSRGISDNKR